MYTVNADVSQRSIAEAHRKYVETVTTIKNGLARAEKRADAERNRADKAEAELSKVIEDNKALKAQLAGSTSS